MKKFKVFLSLFKERDWLEEMATKGWLLKDMTLGMIYHFEKMEPAEKVYEIDRFTVLRKPKKNMLLARKTALDIASQSGWEVVTHDEDMNYYFVKDKAGDESDEFYDDAELRRERAEKYRRHLTYDVLMELLGVVLFVSVVCLLGFGVLEFLGDSGESICGLAWGYLVLVAFLSGYSLFALWYGDWVYEELCLSREEWEQRKRFGEKRKFSKTQSLLSFLQKKNEQGLVLVDYSDGKYLFEETETDFQYEIDTKQALVKRLKAQGKKYHWERKDWNLQSFQWYEMSIAEAQSRGLELVCIIDGETLVYKRNSEIQGQDLLCDADYNESMGWKQKVLSKGWIGLLPFVIGAVIGFLVAILN